MKRRSGGEAPRDYGNALLAALLFTFFCVTAMLLLIVSVFIFIRFLL